MLHHRFSASMRGSTPFRAFSTTVHARASYNEDNSVLIDDFLELASSLPATDKPIRPNDKRVAPKGFPPRFTGTSTTTGSNGIVFTKMATDNYPRMPATGPRPSTTVRANDPSHPPRMAFAARNPSDRPPRSNDIRRAPRPTGPPPSRARFAGQGPGQKTRTRDRQRDRTRDDATPASNGAELPLPEPSPYTPHHVTLESLMVHVPATPLTVAGLASSLAREMKASGGPPEELNLAVWKAYEGRRDEYLQTVVQGEYGQVANGDRTVVGEVRRMCARNGTMGDQAAKQFIGEVESYVGALKLPGPVQGKLLEA